MSVGAFGTSYFCLKGLQELPGVLWVAVARLLSFYETSSLLVHNFQQNRAPHVVLYGARGVICAAHLTSLINFLPLVPNVLCHNLGVWDPSFQWCLRFWCQIFSARNFAIPSFAHTKPPPPPGEDETANPEPKAVSKQLCMTVSPKFGWTKLDVCVKDWRSTALLPAFFPKGGLYEPHVLTDLFIRRCTCFLST